MMKKLANNFYYSLLVNGEHRNFGIDFKEVVLRLQVNNLLESEVEDSYFLIHQLL